MAKNVVGSILDITKYYVLRDIEKVKTIWERIRSFYPGTKQITVAKAINTWKEAKTAASYLRRSGPNRPVDTLKMPLIGTKIRRSISVDISFSFVNPETEELQKAGFNIKAPLGMTKSQLEKYLQGKIFEWIYQHYELRRGDWTNFNRLVPELKLIAIAGE